MTKYLEINYINEKVEFIRHCELTNEDTREILQAIEATESIEDVTYIERVNRDAGEGIDIIVKTGIEESNKTYPVMRHSYAYYVLKLVKEKITERELQQILDDALKAQKAILGGMSEHMAINTYLRRRAI